MRPTAALALAVTLVGASCTSNGDSSAPDRTSSAVIVTSPAEPSVTAAPESLPDSSPDSPPTTTATDDPAGTQPGVSTATTAAAPTTPSTPAPVVGAPVVGTERVVGFDQPVDLAVRPGDASWYVVEQPGRVVKFDGDDSIVVLDLTERVATRNEQGLLGLVFSPDGSRAYVDFTDLGGTTVIAEYAVGADGSFDVATERVVITVEQPYSNHNAGDLAFGPDDLLYITLGDGGSGGDPERRADDPASLLGSLLRIDPTPSGGAEYTIPNDNPFADGIDGAPEVWAYGLRNPWKIAFDPVTDQLWIPDVGQNEFEEVNVVAPTDGAGAGRGVDFGWSAFEGTERFNTDVADTGETTMPVLTYRHGDDGCSVSGGAPYRGSEIAELEPAFVYSDFCSGVLWALDVEGGRNLVLLEGLDSVSAVRVGPDGELYVLERSGSMLRLVPG